MVSENSRAFVTALFGFDAVVQRVEPEQWDLPSPCEHWDAREVVNHNIVMAHMLLQMTKGSSAAVPTAGGEREVAAPHGEGYVLASHLFNRELRAGREEDPTDLWNQHRDRLLHALDQPGAVDAVARSPWGHSTVDEFLGFAFYDPLVHTWDLATAVGQRLHLDPQLVDRALEMLEDPGEGRNLRQPISLADAVATTAADATSRLIAATGRNPALSAPRLHS